MRPLLAIGVSAWLAIAGAGIWTVWVYDNRPGEAAAAPQEWPGEERRQGVPGYRAGTLELAADRPTLVLLAHPQCSCTSASIAELGEVLARATAPPRTYILFLKPQGVAETWTTSSLWQAAARLPGAEVLRDDEGTQARRFGAVTSGQVVLYGADGSLLFSGGITGSRGHAGENAGRTALVALLNGANDAIHGTDVFGCPIFETEAA